MKKGMFRHIAFIGKSMLWSLCLYVAVMLAFNWDEIKSPTAPAHNAAIVLVTPDQQQGMFNRPAVSQHLTAIQNILVLAKAVCGIVAIGK